MQKKDNSRLILAVVLIAAGVVWFLRQVFHLPLFGHIHLHQFLMPFNHMFGAIGHTLFSWQMVLIITGIVLLAGRRSAGIILIVLGALFLLPELLHISFWSLSFLIPALLIGAGIVLIIKASLKINS